MNQYTTNIFLDRLKKNVMGDEPISESSFVQYQEKRKEELIRILKLSELEHYSTEITYQKVVLCQEKVQIKSELLGLSSKMCKFEAVKNLCNRLRCFKTLFQSGVLCSQFRIFFLVLLFQSLVFLTAETYHY